MLIVQMSWPRTENDLVSIDSLRAFAKQVNDSYLVDYIDVLASMYAIILAKTPEAKQANLQKAELFYKKNANKELRPLLLFLLGTNPAYSTKASERYLLMLKAQNLLEEIHYEDFAHSTFYFDGFFDLYYKFTDYAKAKAYCQLALQKPEVFLYPRASYYNNMALCDEGLSNYDEAMKAFEKSLYEAKTTGNIGFQALVRSNIGNLYWVKEQYKQALPYYADDIKINAVTSPESAEIARLFLANSLLHLNAVEQAKACLTPPKGSFGDGEHIDYKLILYRTLSLFYQKTQNYQLAFLYKDSLNTLTNNFRKEHDLLNIRNYEFRLQAQKHIDAEKQFEIIAEKKQLLRNMLIVALVFLCVAIVVWFSNRSRKEQKIYLENKKIQEEKSRQAIFQLELYMRAIAEKNELIEQLNRQVYGNNHELFDPIEPQDVYLENLRNSVILTEENWEQFKGLFEQVFPDFLNELNTHYADLSPAEFRLIALEKLKVPTKQMANMLGILAGSIKKSRYRLRKKYPDLLKNL